MWRKLSIQIQLFVLISLMLLGFTIATLSISYYLDLQERKKLAIELSQTLNNAMSHDMLNALVSNETDIYSDLSFRLSNFNSVDKVFLYDESDQPVYEYNRNNTNQYDQIIKQATSKPSFSGEDLYVKLPLELDGHKFGSVAYIIDIHDFTTQLNEHFFYLIIAFPLELLIGFLLTLRLSRLYSQPFEKLAQAMRVNKPTQNEFTELNTSSENEVKVLFNGFNQMMNQISDTSQQLRYIAEHDPLTGCFNRFYMENTLKKLLKKNHHNDKLQTESHSLINLNIDQFKIINDTVGHESGDELLKMIASSLNNHLPEESIIARMESDDFYILLKDFSEEKGLTYANDLLKQLNDFRFSWEGQAFSVSASIGFVCFQAFSHSLQELTKSAENALHIAKSQGKNKLHIFQPDDNLAERLNQEVITAGFIKGALAKENSRFELHAQLIQPLQYKTDKVSYEILLRLWDSNQNFISPDSFLPTAERYQMMADIDAYVLWEYLTLITQYPEHINQLHVVHINLAGSSLNHPDFQSKLKLAIQTFNFPWHKLELELTETSAVGNFSQAHEFINWLKEIGIGLALDDFGTGMSSFEYLKCLPFDVIKIDGSFVKDMHKDPSDKMVIRYIQEISTLRNQETVAEYVETKEDVEELTRIGITYGQGYYLGKPKPLTEWLY
ncbi:EAL domain-containing protein [Thiomicrorhabdus sp. Milos-T2]|uniref:EAL domain-containing protein n=1 Tax=Thiomicrorhabdus sp. Milos-T2 TaxID=90814 RepID=UPI0004942517|nr:EAL domain-containing protein [Thiomicrorhabdus sp. Milos-T2]